MRTTAFILLAAASLALTQITRAQNSTLSTVTVGAPDPSASETGPDPGVFEIHRFGLDNSYSLTVFFRLSGTASNGVDYQGISESVVIPAGSSKASVVVTPIDDTLVEGPETVVLQIVPSPLLCPAPSCSYYIGSPSNATVYIADNDRSTTNNQPPFVQLNSPQDGATFTAPADIALRAFAQDPEDSYNVSVEFFEGTNRLGFGTFVPTKCATPYCPFFELVWSNVPPGKYALTAKATDSAGASSISSAARIIVYESNRTGEVNIFASDPVATETPATAAIAPDTATFKVHRSTGTNESIVVYYNISGTASNGVDYESLSGEVTLAAGQSSADIVVTPIDDNLTEGTETVVLTLIAPCPPCLFANPPCDVAEGTNCYPIGANSQAVAYIRDNDQTNVPPTVSIATPTNGAAFFAPADIQICAQASDRDGYVATVEFFEGSNSLGVTTNNPNSAGARNPFCLVWSNVPPGYYTLTAKATDNDGATAVSDPVYVSVSRDNRPPEVNIYATDRTASEQPATTALPPDTARFSVRRSGGTNSSLAVYYEIGGSASNGVDYEKLPGNVTIPEGAWSADIVVTPIDDSLAEGVETVVLTVLPVCPSCLWATPPCAVVQTADCYRVGIDSRAVAYIQDDDQSNGLPVVTILATDAIAVEGQFCFSNWWWTTSANSTGGWTTNSWDSRTNNCSGTNTATFVVRRSGGTNSDLTVYYSTGGTASNGVDYVTLPGQITIPAGSRAARIELLPIDDNLPEGIETVSLNLQLPPSDSTTAGYAIGYPGRAAAIIVDNDQPRPVCGKLSDGMFHLCTPGTNGYTFCIRSSTDLKNWTVICTNIVTDGAVHFIDPDAAELSNRSYSVVPEANYSPPQ